MDDARTKRSSTTGCLELVQRIGRGALWLALAVWCGGFLFWQIRYLFAVILGGGLGEIGRHM